MLKGHVFNKQIFEHQIFALFIDILLNHKCGIAGQYKNAMKVTAAGTNVSIATGSACIRGRFVEENSGITLNAGTESAFCKLVIEINLDLENTDKNFVQANYKIIKNASTYPNLTQNDIIKNNAGTYQYELARFKTGTQGITEFKDMRTYVDYESIIDLMQKDFQGFLDRLEGLLAEVEDGSAYLLKDKFKIFHNEIDNTQGKEGDFGIVYFD